MTFEVEADRYDRFMGRYSTQLAPQLADLGSHGQTIAPLPLSHLESRS